MSVERTSEPERLSSFVERFAGRKVVVVGDLVADQFLYGEISRVSREAPVFILASLGTRASLVGVLGDDEAGRVLLEKLERASVSCKSIRTVAGTPTTTKVRVLAGQSHSTRQQVIRVDYEDAPI